MNSQSDSAHSRDVSLKRLKDIAMRSLPENSAARTVILGQPDDIPEGEYLPFAKLVSRQLTIELTRSLP